MDVSRVGIDVALGVVISHILLQLGVEFGTTVVKKQVSQILLFDLLPDPHLLVIG